MNYNNVLWIVLIVLLILCAIAYLSSHMHFN